MDNLAIVESGSSESPVDSVLNIDGGHTKVLMNTGAESSYAPKEYILQHAFSTRVATGLPLVLGNTVPL